MKYDFKEYTNIEDMIGYVGFITPAGTFYRVRKMNENGVGHGDGAERFLYMNKKRDTEKLDVNFTYICDSDEFNFTMVFEGDNDQMCFAPGKLGLTKEQYAIINTLNYNKNQEADYTKYR